MVRMLIFPQVRREDHVRLKPPDLPGERHGVRRVVLDVAVAAQFQELDRGPDDPGGVAGFLGALLGVPALAASPFEVTRIRASCPLRTSWIKMGAQPNSTSSGCAPTARIFI